MPLYQAVVLAIVQGLTEFLPISSTAHLALFPWLLGWKDPGLTFDVSLHIGTLVAVMVHFWRLWLDMGVAVLGLGRRDDPEVRRKRVLFWYLVAATIPSAAAGAVFRQAAEDELRQPVIMGTALIVVGLLMWAGDRVRSNPRTLAQVSFLDSMVVGLAQAVAIIPGVSRSGITMTAGLFRGMTREASARFSFLLSTPIIAGAAFLEGLTMVRQGLTPDMLLAFVVGVLVAGVVGYLVIAWLIRYLERRTFAIFVVYRLLAGVLVLALGWGLRHA